jgi:hypothetical protein
MRICSVPDHPCLSSIHPREVVAAVAELGAYGDAGAAKAAQESTALKVATKGGLGT